MTFMRKFCSSQTRDYFWQQVRDEVKGKIAKSSTEREGGCKPDQAKGLVWCLESCLVLHKSLKGAIGTIRDYLLMSHSHSHLPQRPRGSGPSRPFRASHNSMLSSSSSLATASTANGSESGGLRDIDNIMSYFNAFANRVHLILHVINVLKEFQQLRCSLLGAPGIPHEISEFESPLIGTGDDRMDAEEAEPSPDRPVSRAARSRSVDVMMTVKEEGEDEQVEKVTTAPIDTADMGLKLDTVNEGTGSGDEDDGEDLGIREVDGSSEDENGSTGGRSQSSGSTLLSLDSNYSLESEQGKTEHHGDPFDEVKTLPSRPNQLMDCKQTLSPQTINIPSSLPETNISTALDRAIDNMLELLVAMAPDTGMVLSMDGRHWNKFPAAVHTFTRSVEQLEQTVGLYIKVLTDFEGA